MHKWKGQILEGTLKCWVTAVDKGGEDDRECAVCLTGLSVPHHRDPTDAAALRGAIKDVCGALAIACPSVIEASLLLFWLQEAMVLMRRAGRIQPVATGRSTDVRSSSADACEGVNSALSGSGSASVRRRKLRRIELTACQPLMPEDSPNPQWPTEHAERDHSCRADATPWCTLVCCSRSALMHSSTVW